MQDLLIKCASQAEKTAAISLLYGFGFNYSTDYPSLESFLSDQMEIDGNFPHVLLETDEYAAKGYEINTARNSFIPKDAVIVNFTAVGEILKFIEQPPAVKIKVNSEYEAILTKKNLQVGCQTIEWSDFDKLVAASKKVRKA